MIILRQRNYAAQDYAGVSTAIGAKWLNMKRNWEAGQLKRSQSRHKRQLNRSLGKAGITMNSDGTMTNTGNVLNDRAASVVQQNMLQRYNNKNTRSRNNVLSLGSTTTKNKPTSIYTANLNNKPAVPTNTGMGLGKKVAIGVGIGAGLTAAYGGLTMYRMKKKKQQEEAQKMRMT